MIVRVKDFATCIPCKYLKSSRGFDFISCKNDCYCENIMYDDKEFYS